MLVCNVQLGRPCLRLWWVRQLLPPKFRGPSHAFPVGKGWEHHRRRKKTRPTGTAAAKAIMVRSMNMTAVAGGVRVAVMLLLFECQDIIPLAAGFLAPVPASTRTQQQQQQQLQLLPAVSSSHAERRSCRHATAPAVEAALTPFNNRRERQSGSRRQRVPVRRRTTTPTINTTAVSCRASIEDVSSPATGSRPHDAGAGAGAGTGVGVGSAAPSAVIGSATASTAENDKREKEEAEEEQEEQRDGGGSWSSARLIPAAATIPVVEVEGETALRGTGVSAAVAASDAGFAAVEESYDVVGLLPEGDVAPWTEFEDWLLQDTYSRYAIGSGKHVLWRRMVREVPELMERTPQDARERWLRLTGRRGAGGGAQSRVDGGGVGVEGLPGSPSLDNFYVQPPVLEQWEEIVEGDSMGSFRGNVFGQPGLADGTAMTTAPIDVSGRRIQDQYVATQCGVVYELGEERVKEDLVDKASRNMLKIAPATVLALSAAFCAFTALSHHVQVEVFVI